MFAGQRRYIRGEVLVERRFNSDVFQQVFIHLKHDLAPSPGGVKRDLSRRTPCPQLLDRCIGGDLVAKCVTQALIDADGSPLATDIELGDGTFVITVLNHEVTVDGLAGLLDHLLRVVAILS